MMFIIKTQVEGVFTVKIPFVFGQSTDIMHRNKTRQGYARKRILKLAGYFFVGLIIRSVCV